MILSLFSVIIFTLIIFGNCCLPDNALINSSGISYYGIYTAISSGSKAVVSLSENGENTPLNSNIKLFGAFPVKDISLREAERRYVCVGGELIGIRLKTDGVLVVGTESFESPDGTADPAKNADIRIGDTLVSINGKSIQNNRELAEIIENSNGSPLTVELIRDNKTLTTTLTPERSKLTELYKCGIWIRDSTGGIGTLTYTDPQNGCIASLGHGIYDVDTNKLLPGDSGSFYSATLSGIKKGVGGSAGELKGSIGTDEYGEILTNCENGIYGTVSYIESDSIYLPVAFTNEITTGEAQIISTVTNGEKEYYDITIEKINYDSDNKNMIIKVTDSDLIELTGGIVQGMSGSPIIQNGMFVGAVTHVFVNDPTKGYAILAENMLETAQSVIEQQLKDAS